MKFSILIAQYNNGRFFKECYESIIHQSYQDFEVIIVDDHSTDNSLEIIKEMVGDDPRFLFFQNQENKGAGYTKNRCVAEASGEICGFLDPDDAITENALELMIQKHKELPNVGMVYSKLQFVDENFKYTKDFKNTRQVSNFSSDFYNKRMEISPFLSFKKSVYEKTTGINKQFLRAVDIDMYLKLYDIAEVFFLDEFLYFYRKHQGGISNFENEEKAHFWRWVVNIDTAKRRNQNIEDEFIRTFVSRKKYNELKVKYDSLKKFEKINVWYLKLKKLILNR